MQKNFSRDVFQHQSREKSVEIVKRYFDDLSNGDSCTQIWNIKLIYEMIDKQGENFIITGGTPMYFILNHIIEEFLYENQAFQA